MAYKPFQPPFVTDLSQWRLMQTYLTEEFRRISIELNRQALTEYHAEPEKPFHLMQVMADGTDWDPGSGRGVYWYDAEGPSWNFLG